MTERTNSARNTPDKYGYVSKFFHWVVFLLLFFMIIFGFFLDEIPKEYKPLTFGIHKLTGLAILGLMILRLLWALSNTKPGLAADTPAWQRLSARWIHFLLYVTVILMPIVGWVGSVAAGRPPKLGEITFNLPISPDKSLAEAAFEAHEWLAFAIIGLVAIHVLAALYHHFIKKDNILKRMLPF